MAFDPNCCYRGCDNCDIYKNADPKNSKKADHKQKLWRSGHEAALEKIEKVITRFTSVGLTTVSAASLQDAIDRLRSEYDD